MKIELMQQIQRQLPSPKEDRDKVKQVAIKGLAGFMIIMVTLTGLSRTANALTTPQVTTALPKGGRIEHKIEGNGVLKAKDEESMEASSGLKVKDIFVEVDDRIKKGEPILELDAKELQEKLEMSQDDLAKLKLRLQQLGLNEDYSTVLSPLEEANNKVAKLEEEKLNATEKGKVKISRGEQKIKQAEEDLASAQKDLEAFKGSNLEEQLKKAREEADEAKRHLDNQKYERDKALKRSEQALNEAKENFWMTAGQGVDITSAQQAVDRAEMEYNITKADWDRNVKEAEEKFAKAKDKVAQLENGEVDQELLKQEEEKVKAAERTVEEQKRLQEDLIVEQEELIKTLDRQIESAKKEVELAIQKENNMELEEQQSEQKQFIEKQLMQVDIAAKEKEISRIQKIIAEGGKLIAPTDGMIKEIKVEKGQTTTGGELVTFIGDESKYVLEVELSQEKSEGIQVGDPVIVTLEGEKIPLENTIVENISYVQGEGGSKKKISISVPKGIPGMNASFKVTNQSGQYNSIVPIEALKEDNGSYYVLVAKKKVTTLGEEMVAERVNVMKKESNESSVAVEGAFSPQDNIIIKSNKPIKSGDRVRLMEQ